MWVIWLVRGKDAAGSKIGLEDCRVISKLLSKSISQNQIRDTHQNQN